MSSIHSTTCIKLHSIRSEKIFSFFILILQAKSIIDNDGIQDRLADLDTKIPKILEQIFHIKRNGVYKGTINWKRISFKIVIDKSCYVQLRIINNKFQVIKTCSHSWSDKSSYFGRFISFLYFKQ